MGNETLKFKIIETGYLEDPKIGMNFIRKFPELYNEIMVITKSLDNSYVVNQYLRARVIFLFKHNLDINKIKRNNKWLTFDRKCDDFIDKTGDYVKRGWDKIKLNLPFEFFDKEQTIKLLKEDDLYLKYFGKSKNRTLLKENPKLYNSIFKHTRFMDDWNHNNNKLSSRILSLINYDGNCDNLKCKKCDVNFTSFNYKIFDFNKICNICFNHENNQNKYPKKGWFKIKYNDKWEEMCELFIIKNAKKFENKSYSSISQKIFWGVYEQLSIAQKEKCYFKELNNEFFLNTKSGFYFVDFKCENKIIEFDGVYWHRNTIEKDTIRNESYEKLGYKVLIINENDLTKNKINNELINKCLEFIKDEN
jgi:very-short-patch-repair endonuclease